MQRDGDVTENHGMFSKWSSESKEVSCAASVLTMACPAHPSKDYGPRFAWHCQAMNIINTVIINLTNLEVPSLLAAKLLVGCN